MCTGLVSDDVDGDLALQKLSEHISSVTYYAHRQWSLGFFGRKNTSNRVIEVMCHLVEVAVFNAALEA